MGADWYVSPTGSDDPNGSMSHPFSTVQQALDAAQSGDRIILQPGTYSGWGNRNLNPQGKILIIQSIAPEDLDIVHTTVIDPNGLGRGFVFNQNEGPDFVLQGLTIRNTYCSQQDNPPHGSGLYCSHASPIIRYCIFENCINDFGWGGGFYGEYSNASFEHCLFTGNQGRYGGAAAANQESSISFNYCTIAGNTALFGGGGIMGEFGSSISVRNSIVFFNQVEPPNEQKGRQIGLRRSSLAASYSCLSNQIGDIEIDTDSSLTLGEEIQHLDPGFAVYEESDPSKRDFHLKSHYGRWDPQSRSWVQDSFTSPCINKGDPNEPWQAEPWPNGKRVNPGFYGGTHQASLYGSPADFNIDGYVNLADLSEWLEFWLSDSPSVFYDLNFDGNIDMGDFEPFSREWLHLRE